MSAHPTLNRHQRRAVSIAADKAGINERHNGVSHADLTVESFSLLERALVANRNILSDHHRTALFALVGLFTKSPKGCYPAGGPSACRLAWGRRVPSLHGAPRWCGWASITSR